MKEIESEYSFTNIPERWLSERYYDHLACACIAPSIGSEVILNFPGMQRGLILQKYGFMFYSVGAGNLYQEYTYTLMNNYLVTLIVGGHPIEGYSGKWYPITGYLEAVPALIGITSYRTGTIFNPAMLVDIEIPIHEINTVCTVEAVTTQVFPDNICLCARLIGKYVE